MMVFDQPGWLWGLLALAVPLAIHLLNATSGRPVPFPGQRFAVESPARRVRSLHLRQPWLLALRLALFALLTLALAGPRWVEPAAAAGGAGQWITPMALQAADAELKESLLTESNAALVSPGLPPASTAPGAANAEPAGVLLKQLLAAETADLPAKLTLTDHPLDRPWRLLGPEGFTIDEVKWRPGPLRVGLAVAPDRAADGRYLRAALSALSSQGHLVWRELPDPDPVDILITLGTAPGIVPEHRLRLADAAEAAAASYHPAFLVLGDEQFALRIAPAAAGAVPLVAARVPKAGESPKSALSLEPGEIPTIRFASRFNPEWTPLVASGLFPDVLRSWLSWFDVLPQPLTPRAPEPLARWVLWLIAALWLFERFLAGRRREQASHA